MTVVLIEHDIGVVLGLSHHVLVLDYGRKVGDGTPDQVRAKLGLVQTTGLARHAQHLFAKVDGGGRRLFAIFLPVRVKNRFGDVGVEERSQGGKAFNRYHPKAYRHARHRDDFGCAGADRSGATWLEALAVESAVNLGQTGGIVMYVFAQSLRESVPGGLGDLDWWLGKPPQLPMSCTGIPCSKS